MISENNTATKDIFYAVNSQNQARREDISYNNYTSGLNIQPWDFYMLFIGLITP